MAELHVTSVTLDPRRPGAARIHATDGRVWTVARETAQACGATQGAPLTAALESALDAAAETEGALRAALRVLARRSFARRDLARRLRQKSHSDHAVAGALEHLERTGLLDDARYALGYVETRANRGRGPARLRRDLGAMGVSSQDIDAALRQRWPEGGPSDDTPRALAQKRLRRMVNLPREVQRRRLLAFLARRGYTGDTARKAVADALKGAADGVRREA